MVLLDAGWKVDLILREERPFIRSEFERREAAEISGVEVHVATAEDTIIAKLEWAQAGESERQLRDVVGILELSGEGLDRSYIERWIDELGLRALWGARGRRGDGPLLARPPETHRLEALRPGDPPALQRTRLAAPAVATVAWKEPEPLGSRPQVSPLSRPDGLSSSG